MKRSRRRKRPDRRTQARVRAGYVHLSDRIHPRLESRLFNLGHPRQDIVQNFDDEYHGPMRLRVALANDYPAPAAQVLSQMGAENVTKIASSFGVSRDEQLSLLNAAGAYGVFAQTRRVLRAERG